MIVQNISKMDHKVTIELSADELIRICNIFYMTKEKKDDLYYQLYSELAIAMEMCQYGHLDNFSLSCIVKARNRCSDGLTYGILSKEQADIFNNYIEGNDMPTAFGNSDWNQIYAMIVGNRKTDKIKKWIDKVEK